MSVRFHLASGARTRAAEILLVSRGFDGVFRGGLTGFYGFYF